MKRRILTVVLPVLLFVGCASVITDENEKMYILASALTKLSSAVESTVRYKSPPEATSDDGLLAMATRHDPQLLTPFAPYQLKVLREERHAIVLVCTRDGKKALLEDAGCTAKFDVYLWQMTPPKSCAFTLSVQEVCAASGHPKL